MNLGEFRKLTADLPDDTLILKESNYPQVNNVIFILTPVGIVKHKNYPFVDAAHKIKFFKDGKEYEMEYPLTSKALVISRYYDEDFTIPRNGVINGVIDRLI